MNVIYYLCSCFRVLWAQTNIACHILELTSLRGYSFEILCRLKHYKLYLTGVTLEGVPNIKVPSAFIVLKLRHFIYASNRLQQIQTRRLLLIKLVMMRWRWRKSRDKLRLLVGETPIALELEVSKKRKGLWVSCDRANCLSTMVEVWRQGNT